MGFARNTRKHQTEQKLRSFRILDHPNKTKISVLRIEFMDSGEDNSFEKDKPTEGSVKATITLFVVRMDRTETDKTLTLTMIHIYEPD